MKLAIFCRFIYCHSIFKEIWFWGFIFNSSSANQGLRLFLSKYMLTLCMLLTHLKQQALCTLPSRTTANLLSLSVTQSLLKCKLTQFVGGSAHCASCGTLCHCCVHFFIFLSAQSPAGMLMHTSQTSRGDIWGHLFSYQKIPKTKQAIFQPARWP